MFKKKKVAKFSIINFIGLTSSIWVIYSKSFVFATNSYNRIKNHISIVDYGAQILLQYGYSYGTHTNFIEGKKVSS